MSRLTNRSAIELCAICNTANTAYVKVTETCRKTVFVLSQLPCINNCLLACLLTYLLVPVCSLGASTKERHRFLSVAILAISLLVYPISFVSFPCLFPRCFVAYLFACSLGVPCDGLTGDGFWWFPECMSYPPRFSLKCQN